MGQSTKERNRTSKILLFIQKKTKSEGYEIIYYLEQLKSADSSIKDIQALNINNLENIRKALYKHLKQKLESNLNKNLEYNEVYKALEVNLTNLEKFQPIIEPIQKEYVNKIEELLNLKNFYLEGFVLACKNTEHEKMIEKLLKELNIEHKLIKDILNKDKKQEKQEKTFGNIFYLKNLKTKIT